MFQIFKYDSNFGSYRNHYLQNPFIAKYIHVNMLYNVPAIKCKFMVNGYKAYEFQSGISLCKLFNFFKHGTSVIQINVTSTLAQLTWRKYKNLALIILTFNFYFLLAINKLVAYMKTK